MAKYRYKGKCASGSVSFTREGQQVVMPEGDAVDVPDWLAAKLKNNSHFEEVGEDEIEEGYDECPDCGKTLKLKKDGELYAHECVE